MPYVGDALEDGLDDGPVHRFAGRATRKVAEGLHQRVVRRTPVADRPRWSDARPPGTLRRSWRIGEIVVEQDGTLYSVPVLTDDEIAPYVEWDTRPHDIPNAFGYGFDFGIGGRFSGFFHPGTTGVHMLATSMAEMAVEWRVIADREWRETVATWWTGGGEA